MFTGIVTAIGQLARVTPNADGARIRVHAPGLNLADGVLGESIAVNGVCLTAVVIDAAGFEADVSQETLRCTEGLAEGANVNLERALRLADRLGGHLVSGHVDGVGAVTSITPAGGNRVIWFEAPHEVARYIAVKGSIAIQGVSLTVNQVKGVTFCVNIIPHTLSATTLGELAVGSRVNLEADTVARYVERLNTFDNAGAQA
jgi:riboflavin synthase